MMQQHDLPVSRTARFATLGALTESVTQLWFVCHGYGQLATEFLSYFQDLNDGTRYLVAPEGLSRFYLTGTDGKIGASWMTKEHREHEITDYVAYLDRLHDHVLDGIDRSTVAVCLLGFSQGVATVGRWACRGKVRPDRLILWAGAWPPDMPGPHHRCDLARVRTTLVWGTGDEYVTADRLDEQRQHLRRAGLSFTEATFDGGHRLDRVTLQRVAME